MRPVFTAGGSTPAGDCRPRQTVLRKKSFDSLTFTRLHGQSEHCVDVDGLLLGCRPAWLRPPGLWWCSIATGAIRRWRPRSWPPSKPASKQRPRQQQSWVSRSSISQSATTSLNRNVAFGGHGHARQRPGSIKQEQQQERLTVRSFTTKPSRLSLIQNLLWGAPMWQRAV